MYGFELRVLVVHRDPLLSTERKLQYRVLQVIAAYAGIGPSPIALKI